jgi:hypothetical protein
MTHNQKINYMRIATGLAGFHIDNKNMDLLVSLYELTLEKKGDATIDDVVQINCDVNERNLPTPLYSSLEEFREDKQEFKEEEEELGEFDTKSKAL